MTDSSRRILSRLPDEEFVNRDAELAAVRKLATAAPFRSSNALLLGPARVGKTEILRKSFDRIFNERGDIVPFFYPLRSSCVDLEGFSRDFFAQLLAQFVAFRQNDPDLVSIADEPLAIITRAAPAQDYSWMKSMADSFTRAAQSGGSVLARAAISAPVTAAANANLKPLVMIDNLQCVASGELHAELMRNLASRAAGAFVLSGLQRSIVELIPPEADLFDKLETIRVNKINEELLEGLIRRRAELLGVETSDSTIELMAQQLDRDFFYSRAIVDAAASAGSSLKTFIAFEGLYTAEVKSGRIAHYLDALLLDAVSDRRAGRSALEALALLIDAGVRVPIESVIERMAEHTSDAEVVLQRLHWRELVEMSYGFVTASEDLVLADFVRMKYRSEIAGERRPLIGDDLLGQKLKQSHYLMMSRYNRGIQSQLAELLSRFDYQSVPSSLFDHVAYDQRYRGMSRAQVRRALDEEPERLRLPQMVVVSDAGSCEQPGVSWRLFAATGFEGGIYTEANEVLWLVALINSREPLDVETLRRIDRQLESASRERTARSGPELSAVRWYISKDGFSAVASELLSSLQAYRSTYSQLDLIQDYLTRLALGGQARAASEFELVIPVEDEAELIAARTAEQIARSADFDPESINQIKTALIEACINAAEHGDSPDKKIYQHFAIDDDKLIITVSNEGNTFGRANGQSTPSVPAPPAKGARGRGLQIIRALMDEVTFERTDDGARLIMIKYLKRPGNQ